MDDSLSDDEFDLAKEEDIALLLVMCKRKKPKHGIFVFDREYILREWVEAHKRLMRNYFVTPPIFSERYFRRRFRMSNDLRIYSLLQFCEAT